MVLVHNIISCYLRAINLYYHSLVLSTIEKLEPERKCFRLVGGVLVERTVGEVAPAVQRNRDWVIFIYFFILFKNKMYKLLLLLYIITILLFSLISFVFLYFPHFYVKLFFFFS